MGSIKIHWQWMVGFVGSGFWDGGGSKGVSEGLAPSSIHLLSVLFRGEHGLRAGEGQEGAAKGPVSQYSSVRPFLSGGKPRWASNYRPWLREVMGLRSRWGCKAMGLGWPGWDSHSHSFSFTSDALITHCLKTHNNGEGGAQ